MSEIPTSIYPTLKWLVQNAQNVMIRNLVPDRASQNTLPCTRLEFLADSGKSSGAELLYYGSTVSQSLNPTWTFSGLVASEAIVSHLDTKKIIIQVVNQHSDGSSSTMFSEEVDLTRLVPFKQAVLNGKFAIPINFLIINIEDGLYTTERLYNTFFARTIPYSGEVFTLEDDSYDVETLTTTRNLSQNITAGTARLQALRKNLNATLDKSDYTKLVAKKNDRQAELEKLRAELAESEDALQQEQEAFAEEKKLFVSSQDLVRGVAACRELQGLKKQCDTTLNNKKLDLLKVKFLLEARKVKLLSELQTIYPIERLDSGEFAIRGLELPADHYAKDDEHVATALGYTVHLLLLASKYLEIPLRYQLLFMASRSFIRDPVVGSGSTLPLFRRAVEKDRFDRAVLWLKRAVEQLLLARGGPFEANQSILYNLQGLFQCEMCPKLAI